MSFFSSEPVSISEPRYHSDEQFGSWYETTATYRDHKYTMITESLSKERATEIFKGHADTIKLMYQKQLQYRFEERTNLYFIEKIPYTPVTWGIQDYFSLALGVGVASVVIHSMFGSR